MNLGAAWRDFAALVLPTSCAGCDAPDVGLCSECLAQLTAQPRPVEAPRLPRGLDTWSGSAFDGPVREILVGYKDRGRRDLSRRLGLALACVIDAWLNSGPIDPGTPLTLVPVPSNRASVRRRGEDTLLRCVGHAARWLSASERPEHSGHPARPGHPEHSGRPGRSARAVRALRTTRRTGDQAGLSAAARSVNKQRSMAVRRRVEPVGPVVLVDDVVTTGSTLAEAHRALTDAAIPVACAVTIAATPHRNGQESQVVDAGGRGS